MSSIFTSPQVATSRRPQSDAAQEEFTRRFGRAPSVVVAAPGRVNLIGEHIDYNDGFVMPLALDRYVVIAADLRSDQSTTVQMHSTKFDRTDTIELEDELKPAREGWLSYVEGVMAGFVALGDDIPAFDAVVDSTVPVGGGLSSSAALEVATATLLEQLCGRKIGDREKALLCQKAEHEFAGVPCGIMDQFSSVFGQANSLMLIDCRSQSVQQVPFDASDISVLITNTNVKHELTGGQYAERRAQCDSALAKLNLSTWRDVTLADVSKVQAELTDTEFLRARHVVTEISRTVDAADAFRAGDWDTVGKLMYASHASLRDDYDVSCPELNVLVDIAMEIGEQGGVIGSRMTGGGFGGCTVSLVRNEHLEAVCKIMTDQYKARTGIQPDCFSTRPGRGAHVVAR